MARLAANFSRLGPGKVALDSRLLPIQGQKLVFRHALRFAQSLEFTHGDLQSFGDPSDFAHRLGFGLASGDLFLDHPVEPRDRSCPRR